MRKYHLCLVNFAGKLLDTFKAELCENLIDTVLPDFVRNLFDDNLVLCQGVLMQKSLTKDILIEELNREIVIRSRICQYAVLKGNTVCQECSVLERCKNKKSGTKRSFPRKTKSIRKLQIDENSVDGKSVSRARPSLYAIH